MPAATANPASTTRRMPGPNTRLSRSTARLANQLKAPTTSGQAETSSDRLARKPAHSISSVKNVTAV